MKLYIAGPMAGLPEYNYPAFFAAAAELTAAGYEVLNPARREVGPDKTWRDHLIDSIAGVLDSGGVALLPGWRDSRGARIENAVAWQICLPTAPVKVWLSRSGQRWELQA